VAGQTAEVALSIIRILESLQQKRGITGEETLVILEQQGLARLPGRDRLTAFQPILKILKMTFKPAGYQPQNRAAADGSFSVWRLHLRINKSSPA